MYLLLLDSSKKIFPNVAIIVALCCFLWLWDFQFVDVSPKLTVTICQEGNNGKPVWGCISHCAFLLWMLTHCLLALFYCWEIVPWGTSLKLGWPDP